jgi:hypothetical protein
MRSDDDFVRAFEGGELDTDEFRHRDHIRLAWIVLRQDGEKAGGERVSRGIRNFAAQHGVSDRYHETITCFWVRLVAHAIEVEPGIDDFGAFLLRFPLLLDQQLVHRHWSHEMLAAPAARMGWVEPDVAPLP